MARDTLNKLASEVNWWSVAKALGALLVPVALASGFDFKTPKAKFAEQDAKIDHVDARVDTVERRVEHFDKNMEVVLKISCVDGKLTDREMVLVGLRCDSLLNRHAPQQAGRPR